MAERLRGPLQAHEKVFESLPDESRAPVELDEDELQRLRSLGDLDEG